jgi:hypothetical protein
MARAVLSIPFSHPSRIWLASVAAVLVLLATPVQAQLNEDLELGPGDGIADQEFGYSVAVNNGLVIVGARFDDDNGADSGSTYVFDAATGSELLKLLPTDGAAGAQFGFSVDIDNGIVAVGALLGGNNGVSSGAAYLFDAVTGAQLHKLLPDDAAAGDEFGYDLAIDGGVVAVGAKRDDDMGDSSGAVYLFDASTGAQIDKLLPSDGGANNTFGEAVSMDNGVLAVGAHGHSHNGVLLFPGAAYLFDVATGSELAELQADDAQSWDFFGSDVAIDNGIVAVGAWAKNIVFDHSGAAYVFDAASGSQIGSRLVPADTRDRQHFGISVAVSNGIVAVGAEGDIDRGFEAGAAYLYDALSGSQIDKLLASNGAVFDRLGSSIAIENGLVAAGAVGADDTAGSVYLYGSPSAGSCLDLAVDNLVGGGQAAVTITGGTPGAPAITAWGRQPGETTINRGIYCTTFDIMGVNKSRIIGGFNHVFDASGVITFGVDIPASLSGRTLLFQSGEGGTCPMECMSNLVEAVVE